jgi:DNA recombination-dependent growth factor C
MNILLTKGNEKFEFLEEIVGSALNRFLDPHRERNAMFDTNAFYITTDNGNRIKFEEFLVRLDGELVNNSVWKGVML